MKLNSWPKTTTMDKNSQPNPWTTLPTLKVFDKGSSTCPARYRDSSHKKKNKIIQPCSPNVIITSLLNYICEMSENDPEQKNNLRALLQHVMQKMNLIDTSFKLTPLEFAESRYKDAVYQLINVARSVVGSDKTIKSMPRSIWTYASLYEDQFEEIGFIAGGGFGNVFKAKHKLDEVEYAIKKIIVRPGKIKTILNYLEEVKTLAKLNHSNVVSYKQAWIEPYSVSSLPQLPPSRHSRRYENKVSFSIKNLSHSYSGQSNKKSCRFISESQHLSCNDVKKIEEPFTDSISFKEEKNDQFSFSIESVTDSDVIKANSVSQKISEIHSDNISFREEEEKSYSVSMKSNYSFSKSDVGSDTSSEESDESLENIKICQYSRENNLYTILYIQMALCEKTLRHWLDERTEPTAVNIMTDIATQMLHGLNYIHSKNIVHHDIKPSNIFVTISGKLRVQLGDFGLACPLQKESHDSAVGTCMYAAPEQLKGECNFKSDIYSLGIVFLELLVPMKTTSECIRTIDSLKSNKIPPELASSHPKWIDIIQKLIQKNPNSRPTTSELLEDLKINKDLVITKLENEVSKLQHENEKKDQIIREQDVVIKELRDQLQKLVNQK